MNGQESKYRIFLVDDHTLFRNGLRGLLDGRDGCKVVGEASSGEVLSILGPNGSGKSTLIKTICNIMDPRSGRIVIDGADASSIPKNEFAKKVAYVPQSTSSFGYNSVYETVIAGRRPYIDWSYSASDIAIAADSMRRMHVDQLHDSLLSDLSGGQKQRVHIARALAQNSDFFVLDEPTSSLDLKHQLDTMGIMRDLCANRSKGAVIALHDLNLAMNYCDMVVVEDRYLVSADQFGNWVLDLRNPEKSPLLLLPRCISVFYLSKQKLFLFPGFFTPNCNLYLVKLRMMDK